MKVKLSQFMEGMEGMGGNSEDCGETFGRIGSQQENEHAYGIQWDRELSENDLQDSQNQIEDNPQNHTIGETSHFKPLAEESNKSDNNFELLDLSDINLDETEKLLLHRPEVSNIETQTEPVNQNTSTYSTDTPKISEPKVEEPGVDSSKRIGIKRGRPSLKKQGYKADQIAERRRQKNAESQQRRRDKKKKLRIQQNSTVTIQGQFYLMTQEQRNRALILLEKMKELATDGPHIQSLKDMLLGELLIVPLIAIP